MKLEDALNWVENELIDDNNGENNTEYCPITKQPIQHKITLSCGHTFEYIALYKETYRFRNRHKCPYCRQIFPNYIPYYDIEEIKTYEKDNKCLGRNFKNNYLTCNYVFKSGKNKGKCCGKIAHNFGGNILCISHYKNKLKEQNAGKSENKKPELKDENRCTYILKNGSTCKNCKSKIIKDTEYCTMHHKKCSK